MASEGCGWEEECGFAVTGPVSGRVSWELPLW